jgi:beta-glucosidase
MRKVSVSFLLAFSMTASTVFAAVTGRVVDATSKPVPKAMITYVNLNNRLMSAYSDSLGRFSIDTPAAVAVLIPPAQKRTAPYFAEVSGNRIFFSVEGKKSVTVDIFNPKGQMVSRLYSGVISDARCAVNLFEPGKTAHAVYLVKLHIGDDVVFRKTAYFGAATISPAATHAGSVAALAKTTAPAIDSLRVGKTGYVPAKVALDSYSKDVGDVAVSAVDIESKVDSILRLMTLDEKIGQMAQGEFRNLSGTEVKTYMLGAVFSGGGGVPPDNTNNGWQNLFDGFQQQALSTRLKIPIIYGIDAVHGHSNLKGAVIFPHNIAMGSTQDTALVALACRATAIEVKSTGLNWTFAPCVAVPRDERWGRTYEGFGETPDDARTFAGASVVGYQGYDLSSPYTIAATTKHFIADGGTLYGTGQGYLIDRGDARISDSVLRAIHLPGYIRAIAEGTGTIMPTLSMVNGVNVSGDKAIITDLLKTELKFDGLVISDWDAVEQAGDGSGGYGIDNVVRCVNAGQDMLMIGAETGLQDFLTNCKAAVNQGRILESRIDDAVRRILRLKYRLGIFDHPYAIRTMNSTFGSALHRDVARRCVRESMVLLKNDGAALPIPKTANVAVVGVHGNDLGRQCGGWTITWQGGTGTVTTGTTLYKAVQNTSTGTVTFAADTTGIGAADYIIVAVGEEPYAEGPGDKSDLGLPQSQKTLLSQCAAIGKKVVCVLFSGRPMIITDVLPQCDAFVAAWLPGTEGLGMTDVLFGDYDFRGTLRHTWPTANSQIPINVGDGKTGLFPYGFGLKYAH